MKAVNRPGSLASSAAAIGLVPGRLISPRVRCVEQRRRELVLRESADDLERGGGAISGLDHVVPAPPGRIRKDARVAGKELRKESHVVGVVGDNEKIEGPRQLHGLSGRRHDFLALGEAIGFARTEAGAEGAGIHRERRVQVRVAKQRTGREVPAGPGRIRALGGVEAVGGRLVERPGIHHRIVGSGSEVRNDGVKYQDRRRRYQRSA